MEKIFFLLTFWEHGFSINLPCRAPECYHFGRTCDLKPDDEVRRNIFIGRTGAPDINLPLIGSDPNSFSVNGGGGMYVGMSPIWSQSLGLDIFLLIGNGYIEHKPKPDPSFCQLLHVS